MNEIDVESSSFNPILVSGWALVTLNKELKQTLNPYRLYGIIATKPQT